MSNSIWAVLFVMLGLIGIALLNNFTNITVINQQNYTVLEEVTEAAMYDSIDLAYYRYSGGDVVIIEEKFVENFIRRFAEAASLNKSYRIQIYQIRAFSYLDDIYQSQPLVSIRVSTDSDLIFSEDGFEISNNIDAILETDIDD